MRGLNKLTVAFQKSQIFWNDGLKVLTQTEHEAVKKICTTLAEEQKFVFETSKQFLLLMIRLCEKLKVFSIYFDYFGIKTTNY